jgi:deoxyadenosine/deoxycytidine kinase
MTIITIDGNIGSGKSSILNYLHKTNKISIDLEPVENWNNYLTNMYNENNNVFEFQVRIWLDRCLIQEKSDKLILMERSPYFIKNTFINVAHDLKMINDYQYSMLLKLHEKTDILWKCNIYIYLRSNPENCFKRLQKRNRTCEKNITEEYITILHKSHEKNYQKAIENNMNIIMIDVDDKSIADVSNEILDFIKNKLYINI